MHLVLLWGFIAAFIASMPVAGPVSALIVRNTLQERVRSGRMLAIGTAFGEGVYAFLALWGFATFLVQYPIILPISKALAAVILIGLGLWFTRFVPPPPDSDEAERIEELKRTIEKPWRALGVGFVLTVINPTILITWTSIAATIASLELVELKAEHAPYFAMSVTAGAATWFLGLVFFLDRFRERFTELTLQRTIRIIGWMLFAGGLWFAYVFIRWLLTGHLAG